MKNKYQYIYTIVKEVIDEADPFDLLSQGAPKDEYDEEIQKIVPKISKCESVREVQNVIFHVFRDQFGKLTAGSKRSYLQIAELIFKRYRKGF